MFNQMKADFYKLRHSRLFLCTILTYVLVLLLYFLLYQVSPIGVQFMTSGSGYHERGKELGFIVKTFFNSQQADFWEISRSAMSMTGFTWMISAIVSIFYFANEYKTGTIKLSVAYGNNKFKIFCSKLVISICYTGAVYYILMFSSLVFTLIRTNHLLSSMECIEFLKLVSLNFLVLVVFVLICLFVVLIFRNVAIATVACYVFIFFGCTLADTTWHSAQSPIETVFLRTNPVYYWMRICGYSHSGIVMETFGYCISSMAILLLCAFFILRKQEIK